ncbi:MAG: hypothetical protein RIS88_2252 [Pseudomonadota bacterium]|jgi:DNA-binding NarL/FixJ family response regulator
MDPTELHAFVVEDNPSLCETLVGTLQELTCVRVIGTGHTEAQAANWLSQHMSDWDLLVIDLFLRGGSGMHLVEGLAVRASWQKVVLFSNYVTAGVRKRGAQLGVDAVFDKSIEIDALVDYCIRQCVLRGQALARGLNGAGDAPPARRPIPLPAPTSPPA